jgi:hypothetical protein
VHTTVLILNLRSTPNNFNITPIFNASIPQLDFNVMFSLRTVISVTVEEINIGALYLDLPAFNLTVNTLTNALSSCQPAPAGTPSDEIFAELIQASGAFVAQLSYEVLDGNLSGIIDTWPIGPAMESCYAFFPGLASLGAVPSSSKSPNLTAASITTCSTGGATNATGTSGVSVAFKSLSPGAKAGAVIGECPRLSVQKYVSDAQKIHHLLLQRCTDLDFLHHRDFSRRHAYCSSILVRRPRKFST